MIEGGTSAPDEQQQQLLQFFYQSPAGLIDFDGDGQVRLINPEAVNLLLSTFEVADVDNVYEVFRQTEPRLRELVESTGQRVGRAIDQLVIRAGGSGPRAIGLTVVRVDPDRLMALITNETVELARSMYADLFSPCGTPAEVLTAATSSLDPLLGASGFSFAEANDTEHPFGHASQTLSILSSRSSIEAGQPHWGAVNPDAQTLVIVPLPGRGLTGAPDLPRAVVRVWYDREIRIDQVAARRLTAFAEILEASLQRTKASESLRESDARFRLVFSSIDEGYCLAEIVQDPNGRPIDYRFVEVNPLFEEMTGLADAQGKCAYEMVPDLEPEWLETYARVALDKEAIRFEQGSPAMGRWFDVFAMPVDPVGRFVIVFKDQTVRRQAENALRTSEELFRNMSNSSPLLIWMQNPAGSVEFANTRFCQFLGVTADEVRQPGWSAITHVQDGVEYFRNLAVAVQRQEEFHGEIRTLRADGTWRWLESWASPRFTHDGEYVGHLGTSADVTERIELEQERERVRKRTERKRANAELRSELVAAIDSVHGTNARAEAVLKLLVPRLADYGSIETPYASEHIVAVTHRSPEMLDVLRRVREVLHPKSRQSSFLCRIADGENALTTEFGLRNTVHLRLDASAKALHDQLSPVSEILVPLGLGGGTKGVLILGVSDSTRGGFTDDDLANLAELADRTSLALGAAQVREAEHTIAVRLQQALLPDALVEHPDVIVSAHYEASASLLQVGGDWYDSFLWPEGRVGIVVGDVVGHGLESAAAMGRLRTTVAALAPHLGPHPAELLDALGTFMLGPNGTNYATACCAVLDTASGALLYASAGHPPMLLVSPDSTFEWLTDGQSPPFCGITFPKRVNTSRQLLPGSVLIAFSDGLVERRRELIDVGLARLEETVANLLPGGSDGLANRIVSRMALNTSEDDMVVVVLEYRPTTDRSE